MDSANIDRRIFKLLREYYIIMQLGKLYEDKSIAGTNSVPSTLVAAPYNTTI